MALNPRFEPGVFGYDSAVPSDVEAVTVSARGVGGAVSVAGATALGSADGLDRFSVPLAHNEGFASVSLGNGARAGALRL